jgi:hypothetical protein
MNRRSPTLTISFDKDSSDLYSMIQIDSSATEINASGLIRKIIREHYDNRKKSDSSQGTARETKLH